MIKKNFVTRFCFILVLLVVVSSFVVFILFSMKENIVYFYEPSEISTLDIKNISSKNIRLGGVVLKNSVTVSGDLIEFEVSDLNHSIKVKYYGVVPILFKDGRGVIISGILSDDKKSFTANSVFVKHNEVYVPDKYYDEYKNKIMK